MTFTKINAAGIGTTETVTVDGLTVINDGSFGGNLTVGGVLTYEDVTNVDSVGLITARNGIVVGSGITLSKDGDIFATGITTVSGNVKVGTGITLSPDGDGFFTGVITATSYSGIDLSDVTGATGDFSIADKIVHTGDTNTSLRFPAADTITAETGGSERLRINSSGKVIVGNDGTTFGNAAVQAFIQHGNTAGESGFSSVDTTSVAAGVGGEIAFHGKYNTGAQDYAYYGHVRGVKENATNGNTACALTFHTRPDATAPQERVRIDSEGRLVIGHTEARTVDSQKHRLHLIGTTYATSGLSQQRYQNNSSGASIILSHSRSDTIGNQTILQSGDELGKIRFVGSDGVDLENVGAQIVALATANFAENDVPTKLTFDVTSDGSNNPTTRMTITETGVDIAGECEADSLDINGATSPCDITHTGGYALRLSRNSRYLAFNANYGGSNTHSSLDTDNAKIAIYIGSTRKYNFGAGDFSPESDGDLDLGGTTKRFQNIIGKHVNLRQDRPKITLNCIASSTISPKGLINFESANNDNEEDMYRINFFEGAAGNDTSNPNGSIRYNGSTADGGDGSIRFANEAGTRILYMNRLGNGGTSGTWTVGSDQRKKDNIVTVPNALNTVSQLRGVNFNWKEKYGGFADSGVIAQEVESVLPHLILTQDGARDTDDDGNVVNMKNMNYNGLWGVMIEAVKELKSKNEALEARIAALEG